MSVFTEMCGCMKRASRAGPWRALWLPVHLLQATVGLFTPPELRSTGLNVFQSINTNTGPIETGNKTRNLFLNIGFAPKITPFWRP